MMSKQLKCMFSVARSCGSWASACSSRTELQVALVGQPGLVTMPRNPGLVEIYPLDASPDAAAGAVLCAR